MKTKILAEVPYSCFIEVSLELAKQLSECNLYKSESYRNDNFKSANETIEFKFIDEKVFHEPTAEVINMQAVLEENNRLTRLVESLEAKLGKSDSKELEVL